MNQYAVELKNISKTYLLDKVEVKASDDVSFNIKSGSFTALSGPSGSGKSTLLNIIGLIDLPNKGKVILEGNDIYGEKDFSSKISWKLNSKLTDLRRKSIGFIFQSFNLIPVLTVKENIELPLKLGKSKASVMKEKEKTEWIDFLIETAGLTAWKNHKPSELSGGQRQRTAIARALVTKAPVILADEPTANLDSKNGQQILNLIKKINEELKTTFIFSTHDQKIVDMADHVIQLKDGKVISDNQ